MGDNADVPIRPSFAKVDGLEIRLATSAKSSAPTVLMLGPWHASIFAFLPIWPGGHSIWEEQAPKYARIASEWLGGGYSKTRS